MDALHIKEVVGNSIIGTANFGPRFPSVEVGKMAPMLRKAEDPDGLARAGFLDPAVPAELNLVSAPLIRSRMATLSLVAQEHPTWLAPGKMLKGRPSIAYVPPEVMTSPTHLGLFNLCRIEDSVSAKVGSLWLQEPSELPAVREMLKRLRRKTRDGKNDGDDAEWGHLRDQFPLRSDGSFLVELARQKHYLAWLGELIGTADFMGAEFMAPPVAVVTKELTTSPQRQAEMNLIARKLWSKAAGLRTTKPLYSLTVHPSALDVPNLLTAALHAFAQAVTLDDNPYYGVHIHLNDLQGVVKNGDRIRIAREFVRDAARIANENNMFSWVSDVGPVGPVFLDEGASFVSYHPGMTMRRAYTVAVGGRDKDEDEDADVSVYGKAIQPFTYELMDRDQIRRRNWRLEPNNLFPHEVPLELRGEGVYKPYRVGFAKPYNVAVAEWVNNQLSRERTQNRNGRAGQAQVARSMDAKISAWAGPT